jgi:hypothetical protein
MKMLLYLLLISSLLACGNKKSDQKHESIDSTYITQGNALVKISFETISGELKRAMQNGGIEHALKYCNENAYPLTDSLSKANQVSIKRVSNLYRNPNNKADKIEEFMIKGFGNDLNEKKEITPRLVLKDDSVIFYKAILTQPLCLTCHGQPDKDLAFSTDTLIQRLYPRDKAIGYEVNQVRGLWRIGFKKN